MPGNASRFVWRDARAAGGTPGSFWHTNTLRHLAVAASHRRADARPEPPLTMRFDELRRSPPFTLPARVKPCVLRAFGWSAPSGAGGENPFDGEAAEDVGAGGEEGTWISPSYRDSDGGEEGAPPRGASADASADATAPFRATNSFKVSDVFPSFAGAPVNLGVNDDDTFWRSGNASRESSVELFFAAPGAAGRAARPVTASQLRITYRHSYAEGMQQWNCPKDLALYVQTRRGAWEDVVAFGIDGSRLCEGFHVIAKTVRFPRTVSGSTWNLVVRSTYAGEAAREKPAGGLLGWAKSMVATDACVALFCVAVHPRARSRARCYGSHYSRAPPSPPPTDSPGQERRSYTWVSSRRAERS